MKFIETPYLPEGDITLSVASRQAKGRVVKPYADLNLPESLKTHADLTFCYIGRGTAVAAPEAYSYYAEAFSGTGLRLIRGKAELDMHYPADCAYNVAIVGKRMFCNVAITDRVLLAEAEKMGYKIINIKQGYAKCSVCPIGENAAISADASFARAAEREGIDVLRITNDTILLPGYKNGFFGGAAYMKNKTTLVTAGNLLQHPDAERILAFLDKYSISCEADSDGALTDFGSLIPVSE